MTRREFLALGAGLAAGCGRRPARTITGSIVGASADAGHLLRTRALPAPSHERRVPVVIVGGGIAGLSAGWHLQRNGFRDFEILELEAEAGGNARSGANRISPYPWGAHYITQPTRESRYVRELFEELGVITGYEGGEPNYRAEYLCFDPQERLYIHGRWQEGLLPAVGTTAADREEYERFQGIVADFKARNAFTIPMDFSRRDKDLLTLDTMSMRQFLDERGLRSQYLHWYVNYACRDDFGSTSADVSAWAGLHYFASRPVDQDSVLTWPEGNGWIVNQLRMRFGAAVRTGSLVSRVAQDRVEVYDLREERVTTIRADRIIFACPTFLAKFLIENAPSTDAFEYAPWMVANLSLGALPQERTGAPLSWDNVIYDSDALGYVVATHQNLRVHQPESVFTFYYALAGSSPAQERARLLGTTWETWTDFILSDLSKPHPEIRGLVTNIDVMRWGHAMIRPRPGFMWSDARQRFTQPFGRIHFAHSDLSGFSLFEEAQYRGVVAAQQVLDALKA